MEVDNTSWKKKLTPQQKAEYKAEKCEEMQNLFRKIDDGVIRNTGAVLRRRMLQSL